MPDSHGNLSHEDLRAQRVRFLHVELKLGLTFAGIALQATKDPQKKDRNWANARRAYDTAVHYFANSTLTRDETHEIGGQLQQLKTQLIELGDNL